MTVSFAPRSVPIKTLAPNIAYALGLVPLAWLLLLRSASVRRGTAWWWLAGAFGVSWLADTAAHWVNPWLVSAVYPVSQAALIAAVFASRVEAQRFLSIMVLAGLAAVVVDATILLRTVAWGGIVGLLWPFPKGPLRTALLLAFAGGWLAWVGYLLDPGWPSWGIYQGVRAGSVGVFCVAAWKPVTLRLA